MDPCDSYFRVNNKNRFQASLIGRFTVVFCYSLRLIVHIGGGLCPAMD